MNKRKRVTKYADPEYYRGVIQDLFEYILYDEAAFIEGVHTWLCRQGYCLGDPVPIEEYIDAVLGELPQSPNLQYNVEVTNNPADDNMIVKVYWKVDGEDAWSYLFEYYDFNWCFTDNGKYISYYNPDAYDL